MKTKKMFAVLIAVIFILPVVLGYGATAAAQADQPIKFRMTTLSIGSSWYIIGATVANMLREGLPKGSTIDVLPYAGGVGNPLILARGEVEISLGTNVANKWAYEGSVVYKEKMQNLRALAGGLDQYFMGVAVSKKLGVSSFEEIKAKKLPVRLKTVQKGSLGEACLAQILSAYGFTYDDIKSWGGSVEHTTFDVITNSFRDGKSDMFGQVLTVGHPTWTEIALSTDMVFLPLNDEALKKMAQYGWYEDTIPASTFKGQDKPIKTVGFTSDVMVTDKFPEDLAYKITKLVVENKDKLVQGHASMKAFVPENAWKYELNCLPLHPGAIKYYKERGWIK